jgi:HEAT repeat protein
MRKFLATFAAVVLAALLVCPAALAETLTNDDIIDLVKNKLGEKLIIKKIKTSKCRFDVSAKKLVELKKAGVPEPIIELMVDTHNAWKKSIKGAVQVSLQGFRDPDLKQGERSLREIKNLGPDAIPEIVAQGLNSKYTEVRVGSAKALGLIGHRDASEPLFEALTDRERQVRGAAARALKYVVEDKEREKIYKRLVAMLTDIEKPRDGAVLALGHLKLVKAAPELRKMAQGDTSPDMRAGAVTSLGEMRDKQSLDLLIKRLLDDRSGQVRGRAALALAKLGDKKAVRPLVKAFERYPQDRRQFVGPMARFRDVQVVETFIEALEDNDTKVKDLAWEALKMLTGESLKKEKSLWSEWWELDGKKRFAAG